MINFSLTDIKNAKNLFWDFIETTPLQYSERLSKKYNAEIYLKREDLSKVRSYKIRWAFNLINSLSQEDREKWVVCASAWNHAQWFAISCSKLKIKWTVFMPVTTPEQKVYKTKQFWEDYVDIVLVWDTFDESLKKAYEFREKNNSTFVHPFDDERTILWQATIWYEIYEEIKPNCIICPIWWGWVISWIISATKAYWYDTKIIWVEPVWAPSMKTSLENNQNTTIKIESSFVDWASVWRVWEHTFEICNNYWLDIKLCPEDRVCTTILEYLKEDWIVVEPAWAMSTDILKDISDEILWKKVVLIISWSNLDFERLPEIKERSLKYEWLKKYYLVTFPQRPWALKQFLECLWENDDIERFEYLKKSAKNTAPVFIWLKTDDKNNWTKTESKMLEMWFNFKDVTNDQLFFNLLV